MKAGEIGMTPESRNVPANEVDPHFDGKRESIIADPLGSAQMGVRVDPQQSTNPFHVKSLHVDKEMERFKEFFEGNTESLQDKP